MELLYQGDAPYKKDDGDAGFDLRVKTVEEDNDTGLVTVFTGTSVAIPGKHVGLLFARSSLHKQGWMLANGVGVIDSTYRGELIVKLTPIPGVDRVRLQTGERIAQLVVVPTAVLTVRKADELPASVRGDGGFGSTGSGVDDAGVSVSGNEADDEDDNETFDSALQNWVANSVEKILNVSRYYLTADQVAAFEKLIFALTGTTMNKQVA